MGTDKRTITIDSEAILNLKSAIEKLKPTADPCVDLEIFTLQDIIERYEKGKHVEVPAITVRPDISGPEAGKRGTWQYALKEAGWDDLPKDHQYGEVINTYVSKGHFDGMVVVDVHFPHLDFEISCIPLNAVGGVISIGK